jgi:diguanylate cyclase (GGDEF)-like protein
MRGTNVPVQTLYAIGLFASDMDARTVQESNCGQTRAEILKTLAMHGARGVAAQLACSYGEDPVATVKRMRWAIKIVGQSDLKKRMPVGEAILNLRHRIVSACSALLGIDDRTLLYRIMPIAARAAGTDELTELVTRHYIQPYLTRRSRAFNAVVVIDLNGLKAVNDTLGHAVGDELLSNIADGLREAAGEGDIVARLGGDEFCILARSSSRELAELERDVRFALNAKRIVPLASMDDLPPAAVGVAVVRNGDLESAMVEADRLMYNDKHSQGQPDYATLFSRLRAVAGVEVEQFAAEHGGIGFAGVSRARVALPRP